MKRKIAFSRLLDHYIPYEDTTLFEVFRWMIKTGWKYNDCSGVFEWLYGLSSINSQHYWNTHGFSNYFAWHKDIKLIFVRAIISNDCTSLVKTWRKAENIEPGCYRMLDFKEPSRSDNYLRNFDNAFVNLLKRKHDPLTTQLNKYHEKALDISSVLLTTNGNEWQAVLNYGYESSVWHYPLAKQGEKAFEDFVIEAHDKLLELTQKTVDRKELRHELL